MSNKFKSFLLALNIISFCSSGSAEILVGADFGLSGSVARYGELASRGVNLAVEYINSQGGISGEPIQVIYEDNQGVSAQAISSYLKLRTINKINFLLTYQSSIALAVSPLANKHHVVQMDVSAFSPAYSTPHDYTFRTGVLVSQLSSAIADLMLTQFNASEIAAIYIENEKGVSGFNSFKSHFRGKIKLQESFKPGETDFRSLLTKVKATHIENIWLSSHLKESGILLKQADDLGARFKVFTDVYSIEGDDFLAAYSGSPENILYASPVAVTERNTLSKIFSKNYQLRFHETPSFLSAQAFDGVIALAAAMRQCNKLTSDCVKDQLYKIQIEGTSGTISFNEMGDSPDKVIQLKTVRDRKFVTFFSPSGTASGTASGTG